MKIYDENQFVPKNSLGLEDDPTEITLENAATIDKELSPFKKLMDEAFKNFEKEFNEALELKGDEKQIKKKTNFAEVEFDEDRQYMFLTLFKNVDMTPEITLNKGSKIRTVEDGDIDAYMSFTIGPGSLYNLLSKAVKKVGIKRLEDGFMKKHKKDHLKVQIKINKNTVIFHFKGNFK